MGGPTQRPLGEKGEDGAMHAMRRGGALVLAGAAPSCSGATGGFGGKVADFRIGNGGGGEGRSSIGVEGGEGAASGGRGRRCGWTWIMGGDRFAHVFEWKI